MTTVHLSPELASSLNCFPEQQLPDHLARHLVEAQLAEEPADRQRRLNEKFAADWHARARAMADAS